MQTRQLQVAFTLSALAMGPEPTKWMYSEDRVSVVTGVVTKGKLLGFLPGGAAESKAKNILYWLLKTLRN